MQRAGSALLPIIKDLGMENALRLYRIRAEWQSIFREPLSLHTSPSSLNGDELVVTADSSAWLQEISFLKEDMAEKLKPFGIKGIRLKGGNAPRR